MAFIEGVGDEVTLLFALVLLFSVVVLAWISTHTSDRSSSLWSSSPSSDVPEDPGGVGSDVPRPPEDPPPTTEPSLEDDPPASGFHGDSGSSPLTTYEIPQEPRLGSVHEEPPVEDPLRYRGGGTHIGGGTSGTHIEDGTPRTHIEDGTPGTPTEGNSTQDTISLRLKFLNDTERTIHICPSDTVLHIKRTQFPGQEGHVRLIYQGQLLRDDSQTVAALQLTDGCVVHCHVSQHAPSPGHGSTEMSEVPLNLGNWLVPLLVLILALLWYCQFQYPHVFTATATVCLGAITLLVIVITFATYQR